MRVEDERLRRLTQSRQKLISSLAKECLKARERGLNPNIDADVWGPDNRIPTNMDSTYHLIPEASFGVYEWTPEKDGKGRMTQVHLVFTVDEGIKLVYRLKSGPAVDSLLRLLARYRANVWPHYKGVRVR